MKKFLVVLSPANGVPKEGWDVAFVKMQLYVKAKDAKTARAMAVQVMQMCHNLHGKVTYIRELKGESV